MPTKLRPVALDEQGSPDERASRVRDELAKKYARMDGRWPDALDLCARVIAAMAEELTGHASDVKGTQSADKFRESLRGEAPMALAVLCRLAISTHPAAGRAADRALAELARARGYRLEPEAPAGSGVLAAVARVSRQIGATLADITEDAADGRIDSLAAHRMQVLKSKSELAKVEAELELAGTIGVARG